MKHLTYPSKLSKAFDFLPKRKCGRGHSFLVTSEFEAAWKRVFGSDDFTPGAIRAAAKRNDPRLEEVRRLLQVSRGRNRELDSGKAPQLAKWAAAAHTY
jgi:hypothetical protein